MRMIEYGGRRLRFWQTKGGLALPLRPQILAYRIHFVAAVADALASGETKPTRDVAGILRLVRCHLGRYGDEYAASSDSYDDDAMQPFINEAEAVVDRLFPALKERP